MKKILLVTLIGILLFGVSVSAEPKSYIVVLEDGASSEGVARDHGLAVGNKYHYALNGFSANIPERALKNIKRDPRVAFVSEDGQVSINHHRPWHQPNPTPSPTTTPTITPTFTPTPTASPSFQPIPTGVDRINAENKINKGTGVNVAVIDTGIDLDHPDLATNIVGGKNCNGKGTSYDDGNGHGSHVAGTIAALDNTIGVVGVAPEVKLWAIRVLNNSGSASWSQVICGIDFVTSKAPGNGGPITVANMSLGGLGTSDNNCGLTNSDALHQAICRARDKGVTFVVAAGNESDNAANHVPAAYNDAVITVSALADYDGLPGNDSFASFSNYGSVVDLGAPGTSIKSAWLNGGYNTISGTSMASPHVAGAVALYIATHPGALWTNIRDALILLGEPLGAGHSDPSGLHPERVIRVDTL